MAALTAGTTCLHAQVVPERPSQPDASENVVVLSPFEVDTRKDDGFAAVNAGTATKLGLDLKDLAAPYSVMTSEFINAVGITDIRSAVYWSVGGSQVFDGQGADPFGLNGGNTVTTSTMYSIRGQTLNAGQQRNFFLTGGMGDTYNIERIDFGRGPNAVLFNVGANSVLGGGISTHGKRARLDDDFGSVGVLVGSWDYYRATLDYNEALNDKVALRLNLMKQDRGGWMEDEMEDREGITLATTIELSPRTELRIEGIYDEMERSTVPFPYFDILSGWNGSTVFSGPVSDQVLNGLAPTANGTFLETRPGVAGYQAGSREGVARVANPLYIYDPVSNTVQNWIHTGETRRGDENEWVPFYLSDSVVFDRNGNAAILPFGNSNAQGAGNRTPAVNQNGGQAAFTGMINLPDTRFDRQVANSEFQVPGQKFSAMPRMPLYSQTLKDINLALTHSFTDNLFLEVAADWNRLYEKSSNGHLNLRFGRIDINQTLPNGSPNPNFLEAYSQTNNGMMFNLREMTNWGARASLGYILDLDTWGHYSFNLSAAKTGRDSFSTQEVFSTRLSQDLPAAFNRQPGLPDPRQWHAGNNRIETRYYWDGSPRPAYDNLQPTSLFNRVPTTAGGVTSYATSTTPLQPGWVLSDWAAREERTDSYILAFAARYFNDKLIISPGIRFDQHETSIRNRPGNWGMLPDDPNWDGRTLDDRYWRPDAPADWLTYIPGGRPTIGGANDVNRPNPAADGNRYRDDFNVPRSKTNLTSTTVGGTYHLFPWAALKASYGESYLQGQVARFNLQGETVDPDKGKAYEAGVTFTFFNDRLAITPRYYRNLQENRLGFPVGAINDLMGRRAWNDPNTTGRNPFGYNNVLGGDFFTTENTGEELELIGEITRGWRITASYGTAQAKDLTGRFPSTQQYVLGRVNEYQQVLEAAGGMIDTSRKPVNAGHSIDDAPGVAIPNPAITNEMIQAAGGSTQNRTDAINNYNSIWTQYDNFLLSRDVETLANKYKRVNVFTDYTFREGRFKGLTVGLGWQYSDQVIAGYYSAQTIANPNFDSSQPVSSSNLQYIDDPEVDLNTPVYAKRPSEVTLTLAYRRTLPESWAVVGGKDIAMQLVVRNLLDSRDTFYQDDGIVNRPPGGDPSLGYRETVVNRVALYQRPINFEFTTTLSF